MATILKTRGSLSSGLITDAEYTGDLPTTANTFALRCELYNSTTGVKYVNVGTVAIPFFAQSPSTADRVPLYLFGDSLFARTTYENSITAGTITFNPDMRGGYVTPTPAILAPSGSSVRMYGFADSRLNFDATVSYVGANAALPLPSDVDYTGISSTLISNAAGVGQRCHNINNLTDQSLIFWLNAASGRRYLFTNIAQGGATGTQLDTILSGKLVGLTPGVVLLESSVNTFKNSMTFAQVKTVYESMINTCITNGHKVILTTPSTFTSAVASYATYNPQMIAQAQLMRDLALKYNLKLLDLQPVVLNGASADGQPSTNFMTADGIHWLAPVGIGVATALKSILDEYNVAWVPFNKMVSVLDAKYNQAGTLTNADSTNVVRNGQLFGTAGTASLPDGWTHALTAAPTVVYTKEASDLSASDGTLVIDYTGNSGSNTAITSTTFHADLTAGKIVTVAGEIVIPTTLTGVRIAMGLIVSVSGGEQSKLACGMITYEGNAWLAGTYKITGLPWTIPTGVTYTAATAIFQVVATSTQTNSIIKVKPMRVDAFVP